MSRLAFALASIVVFAACGGGTGGGPAPVTTSQTLQPVTLKWGSPQSASDGAVFIARAKGFFAEQGVTLDMEQFSTGALMVGPLSQNQLQIGGGAVGAGLFNAINRNIGIRIVGDKGNVNPGHGFEGIVVRSQLADKIKGPADMKGRTHALTSLDITPEVTLDTYLRKGGITTKDVNLVVLPFPDMQAALESGKIDTAGPIEPWLTRILESGAGKLLVRTDEVTPGQQNSVLLFSEKFAQQRDVAVRFMVAYLKGARFYNDAFVKKDSAKRAEAIAIIAEATKIDRALFDKMVMPGIDPDGKVNVEILDVDQKYWLAKGTQEKAIDLKVVVDMSYAQEAVRILGPYR